MFSRDNGEQLAASSSETDDDIDVNWFSDDSNTSDNDCDDAEKSIPGDTAPPFKHSMSYKLY